MNCHESLRFMCADSFDVAVASKLQLLLLLLRKFFFLIIHPFARTQAHRQNERRRRTVGYV